ncbi:Protein SYS1 [Orchesella cincta]|uniref:Protein SYS1 n=1 Tax=Orchesella cincta TaxID=48709 RepID=A0A1D2N582_ORCCI|nr:Protein SYS1 [Orchesella cincta]
MGGGQFRVTIWDPFLIVSQIVAVQTFFYFTFCLMLFLGSVLAGSDTALSRIFSYKALSFGDGQGFVTVISYILSALTGSAALWLVVKRTKQCLDFTVTCFTIHLVVAWMYNGYLPYQISWWLLTAVAIAIMCVCGEFLCLKTELQDIPLLGARLDL